MLKIARLNMQPSLQSVSEVLPAILPAQSLTSKEVRGQVQLIQEVMKSVMQEKEHYGVIPGCGNKPTLLKAGAEKLAHTFRFAPKYEEISGCKEEDGLIVYKIRCDLIHIPTGNFVGSGLGACNSKERKYQKSQPWDIQNTLYKMACKRALVAAVLNATAASDIFTQDIEDDPETFQKETRQKPAVQTSQAHGQYVSSEKTPFWKSDFKDKTYIFARVSSLYSEEFLKGLGLKEGKTAGVYNALYTPGIEASLIKGNSSKESNDDSFVEHYDYEPTYKDEGVGI